MTKKEKILLGLFIAMFAVPEVLWSPVTNALYEILQPGGQVKLLRENFINLTNNNLSLFVMFLQLLGLLFTLIYLIKINTKFRKPIIWVLVAVLFVLSVMTFFVFGMSVNFRSIGL